MNHDQERIAAQSALEKWKAAARVEELTHRDYKRAWSQYASALASEYDVRIGDVITVTHEQGKEGMVEVKHKKSAKILSFDVDIVGESDVPGYPKYFVIAIVRYVNKSGEIIGRLDDKRINISSKMIRWVKQ